MQYSINDQPSIVVKLNFKIMVMKLNVNEIHYQSKIKFSIIMAIKLSILNRLNNMG